MSTPPASGSASASSKRAGSKVREQSAHSTQAKILRAATQVFARRGFEGASVVEIASAAKSVDRMIYYYFGSKEGLFVAVLEAAYRKMNEAEHKLDLDAQAPLDALQSVIEFVLRYYRKNPEFITLLNTENLHRGKHIAKSKEARQYSSPAIAVIAHILRRGAITGVFRADVSARHVYLLIAATGYFYLSNRYTLSAFLGEDLQKPEALADWQAFITTAVLRTVMRKPV
jgi:TetR/AcrR family transcriptional regulator, upper aerobic nicotinate degradation pathway regulator